MSALWDALFPTLRLQGPGAAAFLQGQTSADIQAGAPSGLIQSCWLTATGRVQALLEIRLDADGADVLVLAGDADAVATGFDRVIFPADRVRLMETRQQRRQQDWNSRGPGQWVDGEAAIPGDAESLERWRLERGWPGPGELRGDTTPYELGLTSWVNLSKGCYLGQETMAKLANRDGTKQQLRFWECADAVPVDARLHHGDDRAGVVTSALHDSSRQRWIGLALVRRQQLAATTLKGPAGQLLSLSRPNGVEDPPQG
ncbi:MAG: glycine cleavage T-protein [Synechococcus sp.]